MKTPVSVRESFRKFEAGILTIALATFIFSLLIDSRGGNYSTPYSFRAYNIQYHYFENHFLPMLFMWIVLYAAFMTAILLLEPMWEKERTIWKTTLYMIGLAAATSLCIAIAETYLDAWKLGKYTHVQAAYDRIFFDAFTITVLGTMLYLAYYLVKLLISNLIAKINWSKPTYSKTLLNSLQLLGLWLIILTFLGASNSPRIILLIWGIIMPYSSIIILLNVYWLIPTTEVKSITHPNYIWRYLLLSILLTVIACIFFSLTIDLSNAGFSIIFLLILIWTAVILTPFSWYIYKNSFDKEQLATALGKSDANLNFLKSQINPHFLFNALNTLYGTALQENADRTGEGIQKLGDMMRFMLHENNQDKISLSRDVDYLNNYIELQKLRTSRSADIIIETQIEEPLSSLQITPMLLIPFVENAFKHGISLQQPSHIRINLQTRDNTLFFDVHNSIHIKADNDPEKLKSGIGLKNVKQRLALLYANKHELIIRESAKEFFIHLTLELA